MSKTRQTSYIRILLLLLALQIFTEARAQSVSVEIEVDSKARTARISGNFGEGSGSLQFRRSVAGNDKLFERFRELRSENGTGTGQQGKRWSYVVDVTPTENRTSAAHASWLVEDGGVLMLDDLLPLPAAGYERRTVTVKLRLPNGWSSFTTENSKGSGVYDVSDRGRSIIFVGDRFREVKTKTGGVSLILDGKWNFADPEAAKMAAEIFDAYAKMLGSLPGSRILLAVTKFPQGEAPGQWEAETRGTTVLIASSDVPFKDRSAVRLHEQLRHEVFHLWFPNAVNLTGDYAWFYEGAALYQSLKLGVALKRIKFSDLLDTLSRAISIDRGMSVDPGWSMGLSPQHYARAMVLAFLLDLQILKETNGEMGAEKGLSDVFRLRKHPAAASDAVEELIARYGSRDLFLNNAFRGGKIAFSAEIESAGLRARDDGRTVTLSVASNPNAGQKAILKRLGYN